MQNYTYQEILYCLFEAFQLDFVNKFSSKHPNCLFYIFIKKSLIYSYTVINNETLIILYYFDSFSNIFSCLIFEILYSQLYSLLKIVHVYSRQSAVELLLLLAAQVGRDPHELVLPALNFVHEGDLLQLFQHCSVRPLGSEVEVLVEPVRPEFAVYADLVQYF